MGVTDAPNKGNHAGMIGQIAAVNTWSFRFTIHDLGACPRSGFKNHFTRAGQVVALNGFEFMLEGIGPQDLF